jgi:RraA family protein
VPGSSPRNEESRRNRIFKQGAIVSAIGFRILPAPPQPPRALIEALRGIATAHLSDNLHRLNAVSADIRPCHNKAKLVGTAFTVKVPPGDNLMVHKAIDIARPGDVIVVDAGGVVAHAIIGEIMSSLAESRGAAGMIIDGAIRDADALAKSAFPVYARGVTHRGPYKNGPGEINVPVAIGGAVVNPGDIVVGDEDGLVLLAPGDYLNALIETAKAYAAGEEETLKAIRSGAGIDRAWVDKGCKL